MSGALTFTDSHGLTWTVYEVPRSRIELDDRLVDDKPAHLTFELSAGGTHVMKRLRSYPHDWHALTNTQLESLCDAAGPTPHREGDRVAEETRRHLGDLTT